MKVVLEIDEAYAGVISVTAVGSSVTQTRVALTAVELDKCNRLQLRADGRWVTTLEDAEREDNGT